MNQALILAEMIMLKTMRSKIPGALLLLLMPFLLAIWLIKAENQGLQAILAKDAAGGLLTLTAFILVLFFSLDNFIWSEREGQFLLSRVHKSFFLFVGPFLGIGLSLMIALLGLASCIFVFYRLVFGAWLFEILFSSYFILLEALVLLAAMLLLSRLLSKFMAISAMILLYIFANSALSQVFKTPATGEGAGLVGALLLTVLPDFSMFRFTGLILEQQTMNSQEALISTFYAIFMIGFYLFLADIFARFREH